MVRIIYSPRYNIGFFGLEKLHPFDSRKYGRAWKRMREELGKRLDASWVRPKRKANREELLLVHSEQYLRRLRNSTYVAQALELAPVRFLPSSLVHWAVLNPMLWATRGTILAAEQALVCGLAVNLGGGFHHAKPDGGEGFCIYNDIAIAVQHLRRKSLLDGKRVVYIDLDAHQGNGVSHSFAQDKDFFMLDAYNRSIYPWHDSAANERIDCNVPLPRACDDELYRKKIEAALPGFLDSANNATPTGLAIYNAGTDIFADDPLGCMNISAETIHWRDKFVIRQLRERGIPTVMVLSGGYTQVSYQLVADSIVAMFADEI
jgi:histone deacetylase 11